MFLPPKDYIKDYIWGMLRLFYLIILLLYFLLFFVVVRTMWYNSTTTVVELFGHTHYQWDHGFSQHEIGQKIHSSKAENLNLS